MSTARRPRKVLLVSPVFHGYWQAVEGALAAHGCDVVTHRYDGGGVGHRLANALAHRVPGTGISERVERDMTERTIRALHQAQPDAVLVVKGDQLGAAWWEALAVQRVPYSVWLYDELVNMRYTQQFLAQLPHVYSYSDVDAETLQRAGVTAGFLPNAFDSLLGWRSRSVPAVTFVGARYPERETLLRTIAERGVPTVAYGREWSRHPWDVLRTRRWRASGVTGRRDLPRADYYGVMHGSLAALNPHGHEHHGLSMRTFESPGVGALSLIDRPSVERFYEPGTETLVYTSPDELVDHVERARREPRWAERIRTAGEQRTAADHTFVRRIATVLQDWS